MSLEIQIQSIVTSFVYGLFISLMYNIFYRLLFIKNICIKIISNLIFNFLISLLYFYIMYKINYANIHPYFFILTIIGFILGNYKTKIIRIHSQKEERS